jgi:hypothetical protein
MQAISKRILSLRDSPLLSYDKFYIKSIYKIEVAIVKHIYQISHKNGRLQIFNQSYLDSSASAADLIMQYPWTAIEEVSSPISYGYDFPFKA